MGLHELYELTFVGHPGGDPGDTDVVAVRRTAQTGPGGHAVYTDDTGIVRVEISDSDEVRVLASGGQQSLRTPVRVRALPG